MRSASYVFTFLVAINTPLCTAKVQPTLPSSAPRMAELWEQPADLPNRDLFYGQWGRDNAPHADAAYTFVERKQAGTNPGVTVRDAEGREWHVKQPPHNDQGAEGPVEVTLSRVLEAVGYHQPPIYFMPSVVYVDRRGTHTEPGGRFRLTDPSLHSEGEWSWQQNPFVGTPPYQGLLVILMMFNSSDLKNENNALYEFRPEGRASTNWYVVRDLGTALGETSRLGRQRGDPDIFERERYILNVTNGFVHFNYHGWHQELFRSIAPADVAWAGNLLGQLSDRQWHDAFRAGGFSRRAADRFIARLQQKIADGKQIGAAATSTR